MVKPLIQFVTRMPPYAATTNRLSPEAKAVRKALLEAKEPDELLFVSLPRATGMLFDTSQSDNASVAKIFKKKLVVALKELQTAYDTLLVKCYDLVYKAFGVRSEKAKLREDLRVRASYLVGQIIEPRLKSFVLCAADEQADARNWLEGLLMIISGKPPRSWNDEDVALFELKLGDLARKFLNLERLQQRAPGTENA